MNSDMPLMDENFNEPPPPYFKQQADSPPIQHTEPTQPEQTSSAESNLYNMLGLLRNNNNNNSGIMDKMLPILIQYLLNSRDKN
jgi:hypothetical protein